MTFCSPCSYISWSFKCLRSITYLKTCILHISYWYWMGLLEGYFFCVLTVLVWTDRRSRWPRALRRGSAAARLLRLWVRIPPRAWTFVCCECCVLSGRGLCDELITHPEESYRLWCVVVCDLETSWMRWPWPTGRLLGQKQANKQVWTDTPTARTHRSFVLLPQSLRDNAGWILSTDVSTNSLIVPYFNSVHITNTIPRFFSTHR